MAEYIDPARKIRYQAQVIADLQAGRIPAAPVNVEIDLTNRCSLGCEWCHFAYTHTRGPLAGKRAKPPGAMDGGDVMPFELALSILDQLAAAGVQSVTWTGGGEPTLHPDFDAIIDACPLPQGLYTHGGHIDDTRAALLKRRMAWVYVSLDEIRADAYRARKGGDVYRALDGLVRLAQADGDAVIGAGFILHADNWPDAEYMKEAALTAGADYVQFRPAVEYDIDSPGVRRGRKGWIDKAWHKVKRVSYQDARRFLEYGAWRGHGYDTCHWCSVQVAITPNGRVWDCVNKREFPAAMLGDLSRETWADIWARRGTVAVNGDCRVMCRGHVANVEIHRLLQRPVHAEFP